MGQDAAVCAVLARPEQGPEAGVAILLDRDRTKRGYDSVMGAETSTLDAGTVQTAGANGQGSMTVIVRRSGAAQVDLHGVPDPEPGFVYEAWIIPAGQQPIAAGVGSSGSGSIPLDGDPRGKTVAITKERSRVSAPTSTPLMAGEVNL